MSLAVLEVRHSRSIAPTRRVALGSCDLPTTPPPGFGGVLVAGVVAAHLDDLDPDLVVELGDLLAAVERGQRVPQPRLRHRFQIDTHGLVRTTHRLEAEGQTLAFRLGEHDSPAAQVLAAVYAAGRFPRRERQSVVALVRKGLTWRGPAGPALVAYLTGGRPNDAWSLGMLSDPHGWALELLGFAGDAAPQRAAVLRRFRDLVRSAHPDLGGDDSQAASRLGDLSEARRILLG